MYLLWCTLPFSTFIKSLISFDFSLFQVFGCLLGPRSFDSLEGPLACKKICLPIIFGNIELILTITIALITYLGNWALVALIIVFRFMIDQHPFLLEMLTQSQQHLSFPTTFQGSMWFIISPNSHMFPSIWKFIKQQMVRLQDFILEHLHHHTLSNMLSNKIFEVVVLEFCHVLA